MARTITYQEAINEALDQEMARDPSVIVMGEDVAGGSGAEGEMDAWGGRSGSPRACTRGTATGSWTPPSPSPRSSEPRSGRPPPVFARWQS